MGNRSDHEMNDIKEKCTTVFSTQNVTIIWKVPRLSETNMLNIRILMHIQCAIQCEFFKKNTS